MTKLDYTIESPKERNKIVQTIIEENPDINARYLEILADYLVLCMEKQERKERRLLTDNRLVTVNAREVSFEGLVSQFENSEDGVYNLIREDKNMIFNHPKRITEKDTQTIPFLQQLRSAIAFWEKKSQTASGKEAYIIKKAIIDTRKEQYQVKQAYTRPLLPQKLSHPSPSYISLDDKSYLNEDNVPIIQGISLMDRKVISSILCNYSKLKQDSYDQFEGDMWYLLQAFEELCDSALEDYPLYKRILECKIDGMQNIQIQQTLLAEFNIKHSLEYISSLWRNKIPKLIARKAEDDFIFDQFEDLGLPFKKCSKCGQLKPAHNNFFSINKTSKDGWYSICKKCRSRRRMTGGKT